MYSVFGKAFDLSQNNLLQEVHADIVGGGTGSTVATIVGTVEILDIVVALVEMIIQVMTTIRTDQQTAENVSLTILGFALTDLSALFLDLRPDYTVNDGLMEDGSAPYSADWCLPPQDGD